MVSAAVTKSFFKDYSAIKHLIPTNFFSYNKDFFNIEGGFSRLDEAVIIWIYNGTHDIPDKRGLSYKKEAKIFSNLFLRFWLLVFNFFSKNLRRILLNNLFFRQWLNTCIFSSLSDFYQQFLKTKSRICENYFCEMKVFLKLPNLRILRNSPKCPGIYFGNKVSIAFEECST